MATDLNDYTRQLLDGLKAAREEAIKAGEDVFLFDDEAWHVNFAKYFIEYMEKRLSRH